MIAVKRRRTFALLLLILLLALVFVASTTWLVSDQNFTLASGETRAGDLIFPAGNITFTEGSRVQGTAIVLCCNVIVDGAIDGNLFVVSGNIIFGPRAVVRGDVKLLSGNIDRAPGSQIKGTISRPFSARLLVDLLRVACLAPLLFLGVMVLLARWLLNRRSQLSPLYRLVKD
jgi:hypothetical protein